MHAHRLTHQTPESCERLSEVVRAFTAPTCVTEVYEQLPVCARGITRSDQAVVYLATDLGLAAVAFNPHPPSPALELAARRAHQMGVIAPGEQHEVDEVQYTLADPILVDGKVVGVVAVGRWSNPYGAEMPGRLRVVTMQAARALMRLSQAARTPAELPA